MREAAQPALISAGETSVRLASQPGVWLVAILVLATLAIAPLLRRQRTTSACIVGADPIDPIDKGATLRIAPACLVCDPHFGCWRCLGRDNDSVPPPSGDGSFHSSGKNDPGRTACLFPRPWAVA